jgi:hypothetical protein
VLHLLLLLLLPLLPLLLLLPMCACAWLQIGRYYQDKANDNGVNDFDRIQVGTPPGCDQCAKPHNMQACG